VVWVVVWSLESWDRGLREYVFWLDFGLRQPVWTEVILVILECARLLLALSDFKLIKGVKDTPEKDIINCGLIRLTKLSWSLKASCKFKPLSQFYSFLLWYLSSTFTQVSLISYQNNVPTYSLRWIANKVLDLFLNAIKTLPISDVINGYASMRVSVVSVRNGSKSFLPGRVPYLYFHYVLPVNLQGSRFKVDSNRAKIVLREYVFSEPEKKWSLTRVTLSD
jgi:hypothetical protein